MAQGPVGTNIFGGRITFLDSPSIDAAGRLRVSTSETLFDSKQLFDNEPLFWDDVQLSGAGTTSTHSVNQAASTLGVALNTAGVRVRQTFRRFNYQPGKSQKAELTGVLRASGGGTGITARLGLFDASNGIFFQDSDGVLSVGIRSFVSGVAVDTVVPQSSWNRDKLDGLSLSGVTLDITKAQIFHIDFLWLGVGRVQFGFVVGGILIICHEINHANLISTVFMSTPNLPLRYELANSGAGAASTMTHICASVASEGGFESTGVPRSVSTAGTHLNADVANALYLAAAVRLKSTALSAAVNLVAFSSMAITADRFEWSIVFNPTIAGAVSWVAQTNSAVEAALGVTANTITGGSLIEAGWATAQTPIIELSNSFLRLGSTIAGVSDIIALCVRPKTAGADIESSITWRESK